MKDQFEVVLFVGIPAAGKTTFYRERFFPSHMYVSLDQVRSRSAEAELFSFCLRRSKNCVIDNTNVKTETRCVRVSEAEGGGDRYDNRCPQIGKCRFADILAVDKIQRKW